MHMFWFFLALAVSTVYFEERFDDDDWEQRWVQSRKRPLKGDGIIGGFRLTSGAYYGDQRVQRGIQTMDESAFYQISSKFAKPFNTTGKDFVLQYTLKMEGGYECSGGYIKLLGPDLKQGKFSASDPYRVMFGPDLCKPNTHKLLFIINRNGSEYDNHQFVDAFTDELTHAYTLIIHPDKSYEIRMDGETALSGDLLSDFELGGSEFIADPDDLMPEDWDNRKTIPDPEDHKPEDWDDRPIIPDPDAVMPPEWKEHIHGPWSAPLIQNPEYQGQWKPRMIPNPAYKGVWAPRLIPNPEYVNDPGFGVWDDLSFLGIEITQVQPGSIFDNFLVTDDVQYAESVLKEVFTPYKDEEFAMYKRVLQDKQAEEELKRLREKENQEMTDEEFYSTSYSSEVSSSTTDSETTANFVFPTAEISDAPTAKDFEFPLLPKHNQYFINKKKFEYRIASPSAREEYAKYRKEKREGMEWSEDIALD